MAATSGAIRAGRAFIEIYADDSRLRKTLKGIQSRLSNFGRAIGAIGAGLAGFGVSVLGPLTGAALAFASAGSELNDMAARTGVSAEALSELKFAAEQSGESLGDVEAGLRGMTRFLDAAKKGGKDATDTLASLGLSAAELERLSPEDRMTSLAGALAKVSDPTARAALAMKVFGKSGTALLPLIADGAKGLAAMREEARALGVTMTNQDVKAADELGDAWDALKAQGKAIVVQVGAALAPVLTELADKLKPILADAIAWVKENRGLIVTITAVAVGAVALGAALVGLGIGVAAVGAAVGVVSTVFGALLAVVGALLSPIGLVTAALVGAGAVIATQTEAGRAAVDGLGEGFSALKDRAATSFDAIKQALQAGDFGAAARALWAAIKLEWTKGIAFVEQAWAEFRTNVVGSWLTVQNELAKSFAALFAFIESHFASIGGVVKSAVAGIVTDVATEFLKLEGDEAGAAAAQTAKPLLQFKLRAEGEAEAARVMGNLPDTLKTLDEQLQTDLAGNEAKRQRDLAAAQNEVIRAQEEWRKALEAARNATIADPELEKKALTSAALGGASLGAVASVGTFSNIGARGFAASLDQKQVDLLQKAVDLLQPVSEVAQEGGLAWE